MKKLFVITLVLTTTICSCTSVNEAMNATVDPGVIAEDTVMLLPTVPYDYSKLQDLPVPDTAAMKEHCHTIYMSKLFFGKPAMNAKNIVELYKMRYVALADIPDDHIKQIYDIKVENNLFFITYWNGDLSHNGEQTGFQIDTTGVEKPEMVRKKGAYHMVDFVPRYAIFAANGKFLGKFEVGDDNGQPAFNTAQKEVCYLIKDKKTGTGHRIDVYDYMGEFLRTDYLRLNIRELHFLDGMRVGLLEGKWKSQGDSTMEAGPLVNEMILFDDEGNPEKCLSKGRYPICVTEEDGYLYFGAESMRRVESIKQPGNYAYTPTFGVTEKDTIWKVTRKKIIPLYTQKNAKKIKMGSEIQANQHIPASICCRIPSGIPQWTPRGHYAECTYVPEQTAFKDNEYINNEHGTYFLTDTLSKNKDNTSEHGDTVTNKNSVSWKEYRTYAYYDAQKKEWYDAVKSSKKGSSFMERVTGNSLVFNHGHKKLPMADIHWFTPLQLKYEFSMTHDLENNKEDKADEKFIKKLQLDANPVLIVTELK